jgi:hypothetical protein
MMEYKKATVQEVLDARDFVRKMGSPQKTERHQPKPDKMPQGKRHRTRQLTDETCTSKTYRI